jgi:hypothetical protein
MWARVFGTNDRQPKPADLLEFLHGLGFEMTGKFRGDDRGWFHGDLVLTETDRISIDHFLAGEDEIRPDLNSWAAWIEAAPDCPNREHWMQRIIATSQLYTMEFPHELTGRKCLEPLCQFLARASDGIYQVDNLGLFDLDGKLLVKEVE